MKYQIKEYCPKCKKEGIFNYMIYRKGNLYCKKCHYSEDTFEVRKINFQIGIETWGEVLCDKLIVLGNFNKTLPLIKKWIPKVLQIQAEPQTIVATLIMIANEKLNLTDPEKLFEDLRIWIGWYEPTYKKWYKKLKPIVMK